METSVELQILADKLRILLAGLIFQVCPFVAFHIGLLSVDPTFWHVFLGFFLFGFCGIGH